MLNTNSKTESLILPETKQNISETFDSHYLQNVQSSIKLPSVSPVSIFFK